ncbi:tetratricopeptide repeat protein [Blastopirellula retiformator]|uniref:Uncharacterized protein n=1 Tax=Blastopirellula retiformator TaxID=2527970 RepID=A0A5C5UZ13_9BACT|nr:tetratricopeptide repeat protein [Blastopirellula retiformator]TWT30903.1 hypothetical protein Enr8_44290 [Blastopirellula retiformator]
MDYYALAVELFRQGRTNQALHVLSQTRDQWDADGRCWQLAGQIHFDLGNLPLAAQAFEIAAILLPLSATAQCRLAECYLRTQRPELADCIYQHLATIENLDEADAVDTVRGLMRVDAIGVAVDLGLRTLRRFRENHRLLTLVAEGLERSGLGPQASLPMLLQAERLQPKNLHYKIAVIKRLVEAGRRLDAVRRLRVIEVESLDCVASLQRLRLLLAACGEEERAQACHARLAQIEYETVSSYRPSDEEEGDG